MFAWKWWETLTCTQNNWTQSLNKYRGRLFFPKQAVFERLLEYFSMPPKFVFSCYTFERTIHHLDQTLWCDELKQSFSIHRVAQAEIIFGCDDTFRTFKKQLHKFCSQRRILYIFGRLITIDVYGENRTFAVLHQTNARCVNRQRRRVYFPSDAKHY